MIFESDSKGLILHTETCKTQLMSLCEISEKTNPLYHSGPLAERW